MSDAHRWELTERPAIYINVAPGSHAQITQWVMVGAEEEGVPCLDVSERLATPGANATVLAYAAAQSSHIGVGVGIAEGKIALHEAHMPDTRPVMSFELGSQTRAVAWLVGSNAGRFVKRMPLRFMDEIEPQPLKEAAAAGQHVEPGQSKVKAAVLPNYFDPGQDQAQWSSGMLGQIINQVIHAAKSNS